MAIHVDEDNLKSGVLGLVLALVEVIRDALKIQALKRMEGGSLTEEECERLGKALMDLDVAIEEIKEEQGITESVRSVRDGLDEIVDDVIDRLINPEKWQEETEDQENGKQTRVGIYAGGS
jgi:CRISPR/Cas system-associated endonuclease Cas1